MTGLYAFIISKCISIVEIIYTCNFIDYLSTLGRYTTSSSFSALRTGSIIITRHKITKMNSRFHSGAEGVNRPLSALQSEPCKCESTWSLLCSWVCLVFPKQNSTAGEVHRFSKENCVLLHHYWPRVQFYPVNNVFFAAESWCCRHVVCRSHLQGSNWSKWLWPISKVQIVRDLSGLLGFCRVCPENFPDKGLKILCIKESSWSEIWVYVSTIYCMLLLVYICSWSWVNPRRRKTHKYPHWKGSNIQIYI